MKKKLKGFLPYLAVIFIVIIFISIYFIFFYKRLYCIFTLILTDF